jgi:hypothetical protein
MSWGRRDARASRLVTSGLLLGHRACGVCPPFSRERDEATRLLAGLDPP